MGGTAFACSGGRRGPPARRLLRLPDPGPSRRFPEGYGAVPSPDVQIRLQAPRPEVPTGGRDPREAAAPSPAPARRSRRTQGTRRLPVPVTEPAIPRPAPGGSSGPPPRPWERSPGRSRPLPSSRPVGNRPRAPAPGPRSPDLPRSGGVRRLPRRVAAAARAAPGDAPGGVPHPLHQQAGDHRLHRGPLSAPVGRVRRRPADQPAPGALSRDGEPPPLPDEVAAEGARGNAPRIPPGRRPAGAPGVEGADPGTAGGEAVHRRRGIAAHQRLSHRLDRRQEQLDGQRGSDPGGRVVEVPGPEHGPGLGLLGGRQGGGGDQHPHQPGHQGPVQLLRPEPAGSDRPDQARLQGRRGQHLPGGAGGQHHPLPAEHAVRRLQPAAQGPLRNPGQGAPGALRLHHHRQPREERVQPPELPRRRPGRHHGDPRLRVRAQPVLLPRPGLQGEPARLRRGLHLRLPARGSRRRAHPSGLRQRLQRQQRRRAAVAPGPGPGRPRRRRQRLDGPSRDRHLAPPRPGQRLHPRQRPRLHHPAHAGAGPPRPGRDLPDPRGP